MKLAEELPHFRAHCRDGSSWLLPLDALEDFEAAWTAGRAFWSGRSAQGSAVVIKLSDILGLVVWDDDALEREAAEREERKSRALVEGQ